MNSKQDFDISTNYYDANAEVFSNSTQQLNMDSLYELFLPNLPPNSIILDAGCGSGRDSLNFKNLGHKVVAFDASAKMVEIAKRHFGENVLLLSFQDVDWVNYFDGIWACASLLHVPIQEMPATISKLSNALKSSGFMYVSFKYGRGEHIRNGRLFSDYDETTFNDLVNQVKSLVINKIWITHDIRPGKENEKWLNSVLYKP